MGIEDVKFTAMNMYKFIMEECSLLISRWSSGDQTRRSWVQIPPWSEFFSVLVWVLFISRANVHMVCMVRKLALHITL